MTKINDCTENRAAFDIGSGTTKITVAQVNTCTNEVTEVYFQDHIAVSYADNVVEHGKITKNFLKQGIQAIHELKQRAHQATQAQGVEIENWSGVATAAFRTASNGEASAKRIGRKTHIRTQVITQKEEAKINLVAVLSSREFVGNWEDTLVMDFGGGSSQFMAYCPKEENQICFWGDDLASDEMKRRLIPYLDKKGTTPNPVGDENVDRVLNSITGYFQMRKLLPQTEFIGQFNNVIGAGAFYWTGKQIPEKQVFNSASLYARMHETATWTDADFDEGDFSSVQWSNMALVYGMLKGLRVADETIDQTLKTNGSDGILLQAEYWD